MKTFINENSDSNIMNDICGCEVHGGDHITCLPPVINIEASLLNVQKGDVMVIRMPAGLPQTEYDRVSRIIRDMLVTQGVIVPVLTLPAKWDVMMVRTDEVDQFKEPIMKDE